MEAHAISSSLQCSKGICETVASRYSFDDYLQAMAVKRGIKENLRWQKDDMETGFLAGDQLSKDKAQGRVEEHTDPLKVQHKGKEDPSTFPIFPSDSIHSGVFFFLKFSSAVVLLSCFHHHLSQLS